MASVLMTSGASQTRYVQCRYIISETAAHDRQFSQVIQGKINEISYKFGNNFDNVHEFV